MYSVNFKNETGEACIADYKQYLAELFAAALVIR